MLRVWWTSPVIAHYDILESEKNITDDVYSSYVERISAAVLHKQSALDNSRGVLLSCQTSYGKREQGRDQNSVLGSFCSSTLLPGHHPIALLPVFGHG